MLTRVQLLISLLQLKRYVSDCCDNFEGLTAAYKEL